MTSYIFFLFQIILELFNWVFLMPFLDKHFFILSFFIKNTLLNFGGNQCYVRSDTCVHLLAIFSIRFHGFSIHRIFLSHKKTQILQRHLKKFIWFKLSKSLFLLLGIMLIAQRKKECYFLRKNCHISYFLGSP